MIDRQRTGEQACPAEENRVKTVIAALVVSFATTAVAQAAYPDKPIRFVVPYGAGGPGDSVSRLIGAGLTKRMGQQVIVDLRPGASTIVGTEIVAKAPADGYSILTISTTHAVNPALYKKLPYDPLRDFSPVTLMVATPFMFYGGCVIMYYVVLPYVINLMLSHYVPADIEKTLRTSDYLSRVLQLVFAFGFAFEVPVLLTLMVRVGLVSTEGLRSKRRYAIVVAFIIAAVITPPFALKKRSNS